ncbi:hypothetical protein J2P12_04530 [Candidatus Bathyarchaeota archaeon]|nr:hypothetical protein [Candidatus Bathyarchaeota archaeon]
MSQESFQKSLMSALSSLTRASIPREISIADQEGYASGNVEFKIGIGNGDGFDILDKREEERVLNRIEQRGAFNVLDLVFHLRYKIDDDLRHKVHEDHYLVRLAFDRGRVEVLVHHLKGIRRVAPVELLKGLLDQLNSVLGSQRYPELSLQLVGSG